MVTNVKQESSIVFIATILFAVSSSFSGEILPPKALATLLEEVNTATGSTWKITVKEHAITFTFKEPFNGRKQNLFPSGPCHSFELLNYEFTLLKAHYVDPKEHDAKKRQCQLAFSKTEEEVFTTIKHTRKPKRPKSGIPYYAFYPENEKQEQLLEQYRGLKEKLRCWPNLYYGKSGFRYFAPYGFKPKTERDAATKAKALRSREQLFKIIKWYSQSTKQASIPKNNQ